MNIYNTFEIQLSAGSPTGYITHAKPLRSFYTWDKESKSTDQPILTSTDLSPSYLEGAAEGRSINMIFSSISPESTSQSLNQTSWTTSPFTQLILLSAARQLSLSGITFLSVVPSAVTPRIFLNLAEATKGWRLRWAFPILSSALKWSLSNTCCHNWIFIS